MLKKIGVIFSGILAALLIYGCASPSTAKVEEPVTEKVEKKSIRTPFPVEIKKQTDDKSTAVKKKVTVPAEAPPKIVKPVPEKKVVPPVPVKPKTSSATAKNNYTVLNRYIQNSEGSPFLKPESFIMCWRLSGPYKVSDSILKDQGTGIIHHKFVSAEKELDGANPVPGGLPWKVFPAPVKGPMGEVNLDDYWKHIKAPAVAYAVTTLLCPVAVKNLTLYTGSSGFIKIWINGKLEQTYNRNDRDGKFDQDAVKGIALKKGVNLIVVKTLCFKSPWRFFLRFADDKGMPLSIIPSAAR